MRVKRLFQLGAFLLVAVLCYGAVRYAVYSSTVERIQLSKITFYDKLDRPVTLDNFRGKVVLVNLWATWCAPCIEELPSLARLQKKMSADKFQVVAISTDTLSPATLRKFLNAKGAKNLDVYHDKDRQAPLYWKYAGLPTSFLLDRSGFVVKQYSGAYQWDSAALLKEIRSAGNHR